MKKKNVYQYTLYLDTKAEVKIITDKVSDSNDERYFWLEKECVAKFSISRIIGYTKEIYLYVLTDEKESD